MGYLSLRMIGGTTSLPAYQMYLGAISVTKLYLGAILITEMYLGSTRIY